MSFLFLSVRLFLAVYGVHHRLVDDEKVKSEAPVLDVPDVAPYSSFHVLQLLCLSTESGDLAPARDSRFHQVAYHVFVDELRIFFRVFQHVRPRAHDAHVAFQHVDELRQLVDVGLPHDVSPFRLSGVVFRGLQGVRLLVHPHAAELVAVELLVVQSVTLLPEEDGSRHRDFRDDGHNHEDEGEEGAEEGEREDDVERPFQQLVAQTAQGVAPQAQEGHVAHHVEVYPVVQVVVEVRHAEEAYHIVLAEVNQFPDDVAVSRRQAAEQVVRVVVALQVSDDFFRPSQILAVGGEHGIGLEIEVSSHPIARVVLVGQLVVEVLHVLRASHQYDVTYVSALSPVYLEDIPQGQPEQGDCHEQSYKVVEVEPRPCVHEVAHVQDDSRQQSETCYVLEYFRDDLEGVDLPLVKHYAHLHGRDEVTQHQDEHDLHHR